MRVKSTVLIGAMAAAAMFIPGCNADTGRDKAYTRVAEREILEHIEPVVVSSSNNDTATAADKDVRISDNPEVHAVIQARDRIGNEIYFSDIETALIEGKKVQRPFTDGWQLPILQWDASKYGPIEINWFEIRSQNGFYNNTVPRQSHIAYTQVPAGKGWSFKPELGTHRYKITVSYASRKLDSGEEIAAGKNGKIKGAGRISVRENDDLPGQMTAWANLPYIYGSSDEQVELYIGGDCADIITGALHRMGRTSFPYTYSQGFERFGDVVFRGYINMQGHFLDRNKRESQSLDIRRGDLLVYNKPQHHVAVFYNGLNKSGDPIQVVHSYDGKGVHRDILYSGSVLAQPDNLFKHFSEIFLGKNHNTLQSPVDNRLDTVEVIRLR